MFCKRCGTEIPEGAKYCKKCGYKISEEIPPQTNEVVVDANDYCTENTVESPKKKRKKKWPFWLLLILLILVTIYFTCRYEIKHFFENESSDAPSETISNEEEIEEFVPQYPEGTSYELNTENIKNDEDTGIDYIDNIVIVYFTEEYTDDDVNKVVDYLKGEVVGSIPALDQYQIKIQACTYQELLALCDELLQFDFVDDAFVDQAIKMDKDSVLNDPWEGSGWSEDNPDGNNWWVEAIGMQTIWESTADFSTINIGVVDNGVDLEHEDLCNVVNNISDNNNAEGHGTHVAGIIGAEGNNGCGIAGIAQNCKIYSFDWALTDEQEAEYSGWVTNNEIITGVSNLITNYNCKVVNLSAGTAGSMTGTTKSQETIDSEAEKSSKCVLKLLKKGYDFLIVQSAGNGNKDSISVDATYNGLFCAIDENNCKTSLGISGGDVLDRIVVVGAAQNLGNNNYCQAYFSNAGSRVDICAPGYDIYSTVPGGYDYKSGTSMAAPVVAGVASLVWSADSSLSGADVKRIICDSQNTRFEVSDNDSDKHPLINSYRMVDAISSVESVVGPLEKEEDLIKNPKASDREKKAEEMHYSGVVFTPEDVVLKMFDALQEGDYELAAECLDPATEQQLDFWGGIASTIVGLFTGEYISWGQLLLEAAGATDVDVIECYSDNYVFENNLDIFSEWLPKVPGLNNLICTEADVYVKYRYEYNNEYYISEETCHVRRYEWSGWRIEEEW